MYKGIVFLDIDGVLNSHTYCDELIAIHGEDGFHKLPRWERHLSTKRIKIINNICKDSNLVVVVSSTWRTGKTVDWLQDTLNARGATFKIIDKTGHEDCKIRGVEIYKWLDKNITLEEHGVSSQHFYPYVILDDDSDMLLWQQENFFKCDNYTGITPTHEYVIKRYFDKFK